MFALYCLPSTNETELLIYGAGRFLKEGEHEPVLGDNTGSVPQVAMKLYAVPRSRGGGSK